jgi:hypothetical protein
MARRACVRAMRSVRSQSDEIERVPLEVYQRYILQRILMSGTEDQARCDTGSSASCQRAAHRHQRSPGCRPGDPTSVAGVLRSLPRVF